MTDIKHLSLRDFINLGVWQEMNRTFLHPMGLDLYVTDDKEGSCFHVADLRDDPKGVIYTGEYDYRVVAHRRRRAHRLFVSKKAARMKALGYHIQPIHGVWGEGEDKG